jgi:hypothetical protein
MRLMCVTINDAEGNLDVCIAGLFAVFYVDDGYIASCNAEFLQEALDILVKTFRPVGLAMNTKKTQAMNCSAPDDSHAQEGHRRGRVVKGRGVPCMQQGIAGKELMPASLERA